MTKVAYELDAYEQEIFDAFESGTLKPIPLEKEERAKLQQMAADTLAKTRRVNIRMTAMTLEGMQAKAAVEGLPYQTLMASVLHKYASGRLVDSSLLYAQRSAPRSRNRLAAA
jgi:predicted DNA binding CopG/RHH family protein